MKPNDFSKYVLYFLLLACAFVGGLFFIGGKVTSDEGIAVPVYTSLFLYLLYFFAGLTLLLAVVGITYTLSKRFRRSPKDGVKSIVGLFILGIILFICWFLGNGTVLNLEGYNGIYNTSAWLRITDMFLNSLYILISAATLLIIGFYIARKIR